MRPRRQPAAGNCRNLPDESPLDFSTPLFLPWGRAQSRCPPALRAGTSGPPDGSARCLRPSLLGGTSLSPGCRPPQPARIAVPTATAAPTSPSPIPPPLSPTRRTLPSASPSSSAPDIPGGTPSAHPSTQTPAPPASAWSRLFVNTVTRHACPFRFAPRTAGTPTSHGPPPSARLLQISGSGIHSSARSSRSAQSATGPLLRGACPITGPACAAPCPLSAASTGGRPTGSNSSSPP